jgi:hypothetical protein
MVRDYILIYYLIYYLCWRCSNGEIYGSVFRYTVLAIGHFCQPCVVDRGQSQLSLNL